MRVMNWTATAAMAKRAAGAAVLVGAIWGANAAAAQEMGRISVTGAGAVASAPDMASLNLGVTTQAETAGAALRANSAAMDGVLARLQSAGIAARDLQTSNLNLSPNWVQDENDQSAQIKGYTASNALTVRVRDLGILGAVLDAAIQDGANTLNGLGFEMSDPAPAMAEARVLAVKDARARAEAMVLAAGASLGKIVSISEGGTYNEPMPMMKAAMDSAAVPVAAGEVSATAQVTVVFEIVQ